LKVGNSSKVIIWNYDIFGPDGGRTKQMADFLADHGKNYFLFFFNTVQSQFLSKDETIHIFDSSKLSIERLLHTHTHPLQKCAADFCTAYSK
jgi:hypothetical protein